MKALLLRTVSSILVQSKFLMADDQAGFLVHDRRLPSLCTKTLLSTPVLSDFICFPFQINSPMLLSTLWINAHHKSSDTFDEPYDPDEQRGPEQCAQVIQGAPSDTKLSSSHIFISAPCTRDHSTCLHQIERLVSPIISITHLLRIPLQMWVFFLLDLLWDERLNWSKLH